MSRCRRGPVVFKIFLMLFYFMGLNPALARLPSQEHTERSATGQSARLGQPLNPKENPDRGVSSLSPVRSGADDTHTEILPTRPRHPVQQPGQPTVTEPPRTPRKDDVFPKASKAKPSEENGKVVGIVQKLEGDFMPGPSDQHRSGKITPLTTRLYIFKGKVAGLGKGAVTPRKNDPRVVGIVQSDKTGKFEAQLPPGTYTVFAEINGALYKNSYDGQGNFSSLEIESGKSIQEDIQDNRNATF